jgi:hypothetical protein
MICLEVNGKSIIIDMLDLSDAQKLVEKELSKMSVNKSPENERIIAHILPVDDLG